MNRKADLPSEKPINRFSEFALRISSGELHLPVSLEGSKTPDKTDTCTEASFEDSWDQWHNSWSQEFNNNY